MDAMRPKFHIDNIAVIWFFRKGTAKWNFLNLFNHYLFVEIRAQILFFFNIQFDTFVYIKSENNPADYYTRL